MESGIVYMVRGKNEKADWSFVMRLIRLGVWSLSSCFMSVLISPHDVENYESGFLMDGSKASGGVSGKGRVSVVCWKDHIGSGIEGTL